MSAAWSSAAAIDGHTSDVSALPASRAASARTDEPVREGTVALLGPFIDTVVVCSMTALVILITGAGGSIGSEMCRQVSAFEGLYRRLLG